MLLDLVCVLWQLNFMSSYCFTGSSGVSTYSILDKEQAKGWSIIDIAMYDTMQCFQLFRFYKCLRIKK